MKWVGETMQRRAVAGFLGGIFLLLGGHPVLARGGGSGGSKGSGGSSGSRSSGSGSRGTGSNPSSHSVKGYSKKDGTHVQPHHQTNPNSTTRDNYSTRGNYNPHTGKVGTKSPKD